MIDIDATWRDVVAAIPSKHLRFQRAITAFGYRRHLAETAASRTARGASTRYLEVGVRRGHSLALVALAAAEGLECAVGIDPWIDRYGGEEQLGRDGVLEALVGLEIDIDPVGLLTGSSHDLLPELAAAGRRFDLVLIDGDHTPDGAERDLLDVWPMLEPGGVIVFDDTVFGTDRALLRVWRSFIDDLHGDGHMIDAHEVLDDRPGWCWVRRAP